MKKIGILLLALVLCACQSSEKAKLENYDNLVKELREMTKSSDPLDIDIDVEVEALDNGTKNYRVLINKMPYEMKDITAIVVTNEEGETYPSVGIFDDKVTLNSESKEKGIKLSGYFTREDIEFKVYVSFKKDGETKKYYYNVDKVTYFE